MAGIVTQLLEGAGGGVGIRSNLVPCEVEAQLAKGVEVRRYGPRCVAEAAMPDGGMFGRSDAFGILARHIFGANQGGRQLPMTAPVALTGGASPTMHFFLPQGMTAATAPVPLDPRVRVFDLPAETLAAPLLRLHRRRGGGRAARRAGACPRRRCSLAGGG